MANLSVRIVNVDKADAYLARLQRGVVAVGQGRVRVGTSVIYAWGIEFGRRRGRGARNVRGQFRSNVARRAGGAFMLTGAFAQVKPEIVPRLRAALAGGPKAVEQEKLRLGYRVEALTKARTPVRTGNLRRSFHTVVVR